MNQRIILFLDYERVDYYTTSVESLELSNGAQNTFLYDLPFRVIYGLI